MKFDIYACNGCIIDTVEIGPDEDIEDVAWELCKEWLAENHYWEPVEEEVEEE